MLNGEVTNVLMPEEQLSLYVKLFGFKILFLIYAVDIFVNYWINVLHHCKVILCLHSRVLYKWNAQVYSVFLWLMFVPLRKHICYLTLEIMYYQVYKLLGSWSGYYPLSVD